MKVAVRPWYSDPMDDAKFAGGICCDTDDGPVTVADVVAVVVGALIMLGAIASIVCYVS